MARMRSMASATSASVRSLWVMKRREPPTGRTRTLASSRMARAAAASGTGTRRMLVSGTGTVKPTVQNRVMSGAAGINTKLVDRLTFSLGCGIAGVAGAAFTTIGSTGPDSGSRYIVDAFLVVVFGGMTKLVGTIASAFGIAQGQSIAQFFLEGTSGKVTILLTVVIILMLRPQGLFASKVRS